MRNLVITKENYLSYLHAWPNGPKMFVESLKRLCNVSPEFTLGPRLRVFEDGLLYESHYFYGDFVARLRFTFFCLDDKKIRRHKTLTFDLESFGIRRASRSKTNKMCGEPPPWYDPKNELNDETRELVEQYLRIQKELERQT